MEELKLLKTNKSKKTYLRKTVEEALNNVIKRIKEANENDEFIYKITKAVLFGSYINSTKDRVGDLDIAIYIELKDKTKDEFEQNFIRSKTALNYVPFVFRFIYGKEEIFKYIKDGKRVLQLHDGVKVDKDANEINEAINYIYLDKNKIIYEEVS